MPTDDLLYVRHICDAARQLAAYVEGHVRADLDHQPLLRDGITRQLEIIGEAAGHLSLDFQDRYPEIPWEDVVGMRHRLIHGYFNINLDIVWETATTDAPYLLSTLSSSIPRDTQ